MRLCEFASLSSIYYKNKKKYIHMYIVRLRSKKLPMKVWSLSEQLELFE